MRKRVMSIRANGWNELDDDTIRRHDDSVDDLDVKWNPYYFWDHLDHVHRTSLSSVGPKDFDGDKLIEILARLAIVYTYMYTVL